MTTVAIVHDYLTQRGGAERVVAALHRAFPEAPLYTSFYDPEATLPDFAGCDVRTLSLDRLAPLRRRHRLALPLLAPAFSRLRVDADVAVCSSSGWAHGVRARGRKLVYCHTPARWLYQTERYLGPARRPAARAGLALLRPRLRRWDAAAAASADRYLANSTAVQERIRDLYGIEADVLPPPHAADPTAERRPVPGLEPGFVLCVGRLLPYKNVDAVVEAFAALPDERLVVAGPGPEEERLRRAAPANVRVLGGVAEAELRWLYAECAGLVAASYEDFGLTPLEAAAFGKPTAALRFGGYLDTLREGETGVFFDRPEPAAVAAAVRDLRARGWDAGPLRRHAEAYSEPRFAERIHAVVQQSLAQVEA